MTAPFDLDAHIRAIVAEELAKVSAGPVRVEVVSVRDACARMCWSYSWAVRNWEKLGGYKDLDSKLKIRSDVLGRHADKMISNTPGKSRPLVPIYTAIRTHVR